MALPKINNTPKYNVTIPSTQKQVRFRPFLVKEEKVLMMALESNDKNQMLNAIADTVVACVDEKIDKRTLTVFDIEYLFVKFRAKSVGETVEVGVKCSNSECNIKNKVTINVDDITLNVPKISDTIEVADGIKLKMRWPRYVDIVQYQSADESNAGLSSKESFNIIAQCIDSVITNDDVIKISEEPIEEVISFIEQLSSSQFQKVQEFVKAMPQLHHDVKFKCSCGCENTITLRGIQDFF